MIYQKIHLVASLFLLLQAPALVSSKNEVSPKEFVKYLNDLRREMAKNYSVPNMHELIWSEELANLPINWTDRLVYPNWFCALPVESMQVPLENLEKDIVDHLKEKQPSMCIRAGNVLGFLYPLQTFIGCPTKATKMCLIGPNKYARFFDASGNSKEAPGSKCMAKFKNVDGLCVAKDSSKLTYFKGDSQEFLNEINSARRIIAKRYNVPNMHKLTWSKRLVNIATSLDLKKNEWLISETRNWRFHDIVYPGIKEGILEKMDEFSNLTPDGRKHTITSHHRSYTYHFLEFLNVHQKHIGCAYRENNPDFYMLCLLGDSFEFELWDFETKSTSEPASKCSKGYVKDDGLCSKASGGSDDSDSEDVAHPDGSNLAFSFSVILGIILFQFLVSL